MVSECPPALPTAAAGHPLVPPTTAATHRPPPQRPATHLATASRASGLGGGTRKHTAGMEALLPVPLWISQWDGCAGPSSWHVSPLCTVTWAGAGSDNAATRPAHLPPPQPSCLSLTSACL